MCKTGVKIIQTIKQVRRREENNNLKGDRGRKREGKE